MNKVKKNQSHVDQARKLFKKADHAESRGDLQAAHRFLRAAAQLGNEDAQNTLGYYYDVGKGVPKDRSLALYWYRRAYRRGHGSALAALNIGTIFRAENKTKRAIIWFTKGVKAGIVEGNLDIAKLYLKNSKTKLKAIHHLKLVCQAKVPFNVGEDSQVEAKLLLENIQGK